MVDVPVTVASRRKVSAPAPSAARIRPASSTSRVASSAVWLLTAGTRPTITVLSVITALWSSLMHAWTLLIALHAVGATFSLAVCRLCGLWARRADDGRPGVRRRGPGLGTASDDRVGSRGPTRAPVGIVLPAER